MMLEEPAYPKWSVPFAPGQSLRRLRRICLFACTLRAYLTVKSKCTSCVIELVRSNLPNGINPRAILRNGLLRKHSCVLALIPMSTTYLSLIYSRLFVCESVCTVVCMLCCATVDIYSYDRYKQNAHFTAGWSYRTFETDHRNMKFVGLLRRWPIDIVGLLTCRTIATSEYCHTI